MTTPLLIPVTQEHIVNGNHGAATTCAVALALREYIPAKPHQVGYTAVTFIDASGTCHYLITSQLLFRWLHDFDQGRHTDPITLLIDTTELFIGIASTQEDIIV